MNNNKLFKAIKELQQSENQLYIFIQQNFVVYIWINGNYQKQ